MLHGDAFETKPGFRGSWGVGIAAEEDRMKEGEWRMEDGEW